MVIIWLALINIVAFVVYGIDKFKAVAGTWRVPERVLIALAVIGGSIGALLGMLIWRHKIRKPKFYITIPVLIIVQALLIFWGYYQNNHLTTSYYDLDIGLGHEMTIVQVSDLHAKVFGRSPEGRHRADHSARASDQDVARPVMQSTGSIRASIRRSSSLKERSR